MNEFIFKLINALGGTSFLATELGIYLTIFFTFKNNFSKQLDTFSSENSRINKQKHMVTEFVKIYKTKIVIIDAIIACVFVIPSFYYSFKLTEILTDSVTYISLDKKQQDILSYTFIFFILSIIVILIECLILYYRKLKFSYESYKKNK